MIEEGFEEKHIVEAIGHKSRILEDYPDEKRCLILGSFHFTEGVTSPLHIVCDYSNERLIDIVTSYLPQKPWWQTPTKRTKRS